MDGAVRRSHGEGEAERLLTLALAHFSLGRQELPKLKRGDERKAAIARLIRSRTTVSNQWIARALALGHVSTVSRYCSDKFKHCDAPIFTD